MKTYKKIFVILAILVLFLSGCQGKKNDNSFFENKYDLSLNKLNLFRMNYTEFNEMRGKSNDKVFIIVIRDDCNACHEFLLEIDKQMIANDYQVDRIYVMESDTFTESEKIDFVETYSVSSVPLIMIFESGKLNSIDIGLPNEQRLEDLVNIYLQ